MKIYWSFFIIRIRCVIGILLTALFIVSCEKKDCEEKTCEGSYIEIYEPVCGCNGVTYSNSAEAECKGITSYRQGECDGE